MAPGKGGGVNGWDNMAGVRAGHTRQGLARGNVAARGRRRMLAIFADGGGRACGPGDLAAGRLVPGRLGRAGIAGQCFGQRRSSRHRSRAAEGGKPGDEGQKREEMPGHCPVT